MDNMPVGAATYLKIEFETARTFFAISNSDSVSKDFSSVKMIHNMIYNSIAFIHILICGVRF
jgi:hypothetical protein